MKSLELLTKEIKEYKPLENTIYASYQIAGRLHEAFKIIQSKGKSKDFGFGEYAKTNFGYENARSSQLHIAAANFLEKTIEEGKEIYKCTIPNSDDLWPISKLYELSKLKYKELLPEAIKTNKLLHCMPDTEIKKRVKKLNKTGSLDSLSEWKIEISFDSPFKLFESSSKKDSSEANLLHARTDNDEKTSADEAEKTVDKKEAIYGLINEYQNLAKQQSEIIDMIKKTIEEL